ncbi:MAG: hypothetical protein ACP5QU_07785 [Anaerolineae bacterium]
MKSRFMIFLGALGGAILFGAVGYAVGLLTGRALGGEMRDLALGVTGLAFGLMLGNGLGAAWMAKRWGSDRKAWLFWLLGAGAVIVVMILAEPLHLNQNTALMLITLLLFPPLVESMAA